MKGGRIGSKVLLAVVLLWTLVPLLWMLTSSLKPQEDLTSTTPQVAFTPTLEHYRALFSGGNSIGSYAVNSILAAGVSTIIAVGLGTLAGYGLARSKFRGKDHVAFWIISTRMAPIAAVVLPLFVIFRATGPARHDVGADRRLPVVQPAVRDLDHERVLRRPAAVARGGRAGRRCIALDGVPQDRGAARPPRHRHDCNPLPRVLVERLRVRLDVLGPGLADAPDRRLAARHADRDRLGQLTAIGTIVVAPMIVVGLVVRRWLVTGLTLGAVTGE